MCIIQFLYFLFLLVFVYKKRRRFDIVCLTISIYLLSSFATLCLSLDDSNFGLPSDYSFSILGTFLYCFLLTIALYPFINLSRNSFDYIQPIRNDRLIKIIAFLSSVYLFVYIYMSYTDIINMLSGNIAQYRVDLLNGTLEDNWLQNMPPLKRLPFAFCNMLTSCPWIFLLLAFYALTIQKMKYKYVIMLFLGSLVSPISGMITLDRSRTIYWAFSAIICFIMFRQYMEVKQKRIIYIISLIFGSLLLLYIILITISRFGDSSSGIQGSILNYIGSPFANFVYFFDRSKIDFSTLHILFPFTHEYFIKDGFSSSLDIQSYMSDHSNLYYNVFSAFIGHIYVTAGFIVTLIFLTIYNFATKNFISTINKNKYINLKQVYLLIALNSVVSLGLFNHYYAESSRTFSVVVFFFIVKYLNKQKIKQL